ncbi:MAG: dipeptidase [Vicinamibacteria bacterium]
MITTTGFAVLALLQGAVAVPKTATRPAADPFLIRAQAILRVTPLIDGHNDVPWAIRIAKDKPMDVEAYDLRKTVPGQTDLLRMAKGMMGGQFWSVYIPGEDETRKLGYAKVQLEQIDIARRMIQKYPDRLELALNASQVMQIYRRGKVASMLGMEGGHAIENSLGALRAFYALGARYMTLTHNVTLDWADAAAGPATHGGLTRFGEEVVREMNRLGMMVDLSHTSPETMEDAIRVSASPVMFSHSSARALCDVPRNVPDAILRAVAGNGGVVMVTFVPGFISQDIATKASERRDAVKAKLEGVTDEAEKKRITDEVTAQLKTRNATLAQVADHIEHIRRIAGIDHVGLGGDYDGTDELPDGLEDVSKYPNLVAELLRRGWTDADAKKLVGENILRVWAANEQMAARLRSERPASTATIESLDGVSK